MLGRRILPPLVFLLVLGAGDGRRDLTPVPPLRDADRGSGEQDARIVYDSGTGALVIELAPLDLPARTAHHDLTQPPVATLEVPAAGAMHGFRVEVVDSAGDALPPELLHHFNLIDPAHRELFLPISRRLLAAGRETGTVRLPRLLFGVPLTQGQRIVASAMLENLTATTYRRARVRLVIFFTPAGRPWPLYRGSPWQMDAAFPAGDKSFDLPPGRSSRSFEASPAVPGTIVGLGGHFHEDGQLIEFTNVTTGEVIYRATPVRDFTGHLVAVPVARLYGWTRLGVHIVPEHRYRVTVHYENRSGKALRDAGMGVVGGLFIPDRGVTWPAADHGDSLYRADYAHYMRLGGGHQMAGMREKRAPTGHGHH